MCGKSVNIYCMNNILPYSDFLLESVLSYNDAFVDKMKALAQSPDPIIKEVALAVLKKTDFESKKYNKGEYTVEPGENGMILFNKQQMKFGKFLGSILPELKLFKIEQFVQTYNAAGMASTDANDNVKFYTGGMLVEGYKVDNYMMGVQGDLGSSCMNNKPHLLGLYSQNSTVSLAVLLNDNQLICARGLVWECTDGQRYYDRIYYRDITHREKLRKVLEQKNIDPIPYKKVSVQLRQIPSLFPYVDTFKYLNGYVLQNTIEGANKILNKTNGEYTSVFDFDHEHGDIVDSLRDEIRSQRRPTERIRLQEMERKHRVFQKMEEYYERTMEYLFNKPNTTPLNILTLFFEDTDDVTTTNPAFRKVLQNTLKQINPEELTTSELRHMFNAYALEFCTEDERLLGDYEDMEYTDMLDRLEHTTSAKKADEGYAFIIQHVVEEMGLLPFLVELYEAQNDDIEFVTELIDSQHNQYEFATRAMSNLTADDINTLYTTFGLDELYDEEDQQDEEDEEAQEEAGEHARRMAIEQDNDW